MTASTSGPPSGDWLGTPYVRFERSGPFARCTIDRPHRRNALTGSMYFAIRLAIDLVNRDPELAGLLITGTGDVFCPGGDLTQEDEEQWADLSSLLGMDNTPFAAVRNSRKPVVSAVNGLAQGGGLVIAMLSDVAVASERATFRAPEVLRGIADTNYAELLPRQIGPARARDMLLTGRVVTAEEALAWGLVARLAPSDRLEDAAVDALAACARGAPGARATMKAAIDRYYGSYDRIAMEISLYGAEAAEGVAAFKERRAPSWVPADLRTEGRL